MGDNVFGKKAVLANPESYEFKKSAQIQDFLALKDDENIEVVKTTMRLGKEFEPQDYNEIFIENVPEKILTITIDEISDSIQIFDTEIHFSFENRKYILSKNSEKALKSFLSFLKIPEAFYKTNQPSINVDLIKKLVEVENFKNQQAGLKMVCAIKGNEILYILQPKEYIYVDESMGDKYEDKDLVQEYKKFENLGDILLLDKDKYKFKYTLYVKVLNGYTYQSENSLYEQVDAIEIDTILKQVTLKKRYARNIIKNMFVFLEVENMIGLEIKPADKEKIVENLSIIEATLGCGLDTYTLELITKFYPFYADILYTMEDLYLFMLQISHHVGRAAYSRECSKITYLCKKLIERLYTTEVASGQLL